MMMKKNNKNLFDLILFSILLSGCGSEKDGLTKKKKDSSEQFLIEKKKPLVLPPDFDELPQPGSIGSGNQDTTEEENDNLNLKTLINTSKKSSKNNSDTNNLSSEIEKKINKKLNNQ